MRLELGDRPAEGGPCRVGAYPGEDEFSCDHVVMEGLGFRRGGNAGKDSVLLSGPASPSADIKSAARLCSGQRGIP